MLADFLIIVNISDGKKGESMLSENVMRLCRKMGISYHRLEKELGFGNGSLRKWDYSSPAVDKVQRLAEYFGVTIDELLKGEKR